MTNWNELQERAVRWHAARFPESERGHVMLKATAELGEVADAILFEEGQTPGKASDGVTGEAADVVLCLLIIVGRWSDDDLRAAVDAKLTRLETPGAHKASLY